MMHFVEDMVKRERHGNQICEIHNMDGYSDRKTLVAAMHDFGREVAKIDAYEGAPLLEVKTEREAKDMFCPVSDWDLQNGTVAFILEWEKVPCACRWNEEEDEMEYADGNWYFHIRFFVWMDAEDEEETIAEKVSEKLNEIFVEMQEKEGIECGDIEPMDAILLGEKQRELAKLIADIIAKQRAAEYNDVHGMTYGEYIETNHGHETLIGHYANGDEIGVIPEDIEAWKIDRVETDRNDSTTAHIYFMEG